MLQEGNLSFTLDKVVLEHVVKLFPLFVVFVSLTVELCSDLFATMHPVFARKSSNKCQVLT